MRIWGTQAPRAPRRADGDTREDVRWGDEAARGRRRRAAPLEGCVQEVMGQHVADVLLGAGRRVPPAHSAPDLSGCSRASFLFRRLLGKWLVQSAAKANDPPTGQTPPRSFRVQSPVPPLRRCPRVRNPSASQPPSLPKPAPVGSRRTCRSRARTSWREPRGSPRGGLEGGDCWDDGVSGGRGDPHGNPHNQESWVKNFADLPLSGGNSPLEIIICLGQTQMSRFLLRGTGCKGPRASPGGRW